MALPLKNLLLGNGKQKAIELEWCLADNDVSCGTLDGGHLLVLSLCFASQAVINERHR